MIRIKLRIWPDGKLVEQMHTEYDDKGQVIGRWGMMPIAKVIYYQYAYKSPVVAYTDPNENT